MYFASENGFGFCDRVLDYLKNRLLDSLMFHRLPTNWPKSIKRITINLIDSKYAYCWMPANKVNEGVQLVQLKKNRADISEILNIHK